MPDLSFPCLSCGDRITVDESRAGSVFACPTCKTAAAVPYPGKTGELLSVEIRFRCTSCRNKFSVDAEHAGVTTVCPECNRPVTVPSLPFESGQPDSAPPAAAVLSKDEVAFLMQK